MVLDERALKAFVLVAQTGSMSKAAERLSVSVSTISRLLGKVESMAGTELFVSGSRTKLYNAGHLYLMEVLELLDAHKRLERFGAKYRLTGKPLLRIAAFTRYAEPVVVPLAARLIQKLPKWRLRVDVHAQRDFRTSRFSHPFDFGVGFLIRQLGDELAMRELGRDRLVICLPRTHHLAKKSILTAEDLESEKFVSMTSDTVVGSVVQECLPFLAPENISIETTNTVLALSMTASGLGIHLTNSLAAGPWCDRGCIAVPFMPERQVPIFAFWPEKSSLSSEVLNLCVDEAGKIVQNALKGDCSVSKIP